MNKLLTLILLTLLISSVTGQTDSLTLESPFNEKLDSNIESVVDTLPTQQMIMNNLVITQDTTGIDSLASNDLVVIDTISEEHDTIIGFFNIFKGDPGKAALYSLVIPGGGQIYNRKWVKAPVIILADALAFGVAIHLTGEYRDLDNAYRRIIDGEITNYQGVSDRTTLIRQRNTLRKYRDYSWFAAGIVHMITVIEAFVDRHLLEFDMDEDLSLQLISIKDPYSVTVASLNYTF